MTIRTRFAPSPTGYLHVGNVRIALFNRLLAGGSDDRCCLRFDDTDRQRSTAAFEDAMRQDLDWLSLAFDDVAHQSQHSDRYQNVFQTLVDQGDLYPCYETPEQLEALRASLRARKQAPAYRQKYALEFKGQNKGEFKGEYKGENKGKGEPYWRFRLSDRVIIWKEPLFGRRSVSLAHVSDPVIRRVDGTFLYLLPSAIDDLDMGITDVLRGEDHMTNTAVQIDMIERLGGSIPRFIHIPLLAGADGKGLSKRRAEELSVRRLRDDGLEPEAVLNVLFSLGCGGKAVTDREAMIRSFRPESYSRSSAQVDSEDFRRANRSFVRDMDGATVAARLEKRNVPSFDDQTWQAVRSNIDTLAQAAQWARICSDPITPVIEDADFLKQACGLLPAEPWGEDVWTIWIRKIEEHCSQRGKKLYAPLRLALTGKSSGPELKALLPRIGAQRARLRLQGERA